jgi:phage-related minor tail protein
MASRSLGTLTIDLVAKIGGFTSGLSQGERRLDSFGKRAKKIGEEIGRNLAVVGTAAAGVAALVIRNTIEAEKAQAQLAAALKSTAGAAGLSQDQLNGMADSLSSLTTFEDDAITSAQALLLTFTKIGGDVFPDAIRAAADMSTALGTDLNSAVLQLGKALNDPIKGLTTLGRAGVQFTDSQKALIEAMVESGRVADAQRIILGELETQFGGSARAARDTLGGALQALTNTVGNLLEGESGSGGLNAAKTAVEALNTQLSSTEVRSAFAEMIEDAANEIAGLVDWFIKWDKIAGQMRMKADTTAALQAYGDSLDGVKDKQKSLLATLEQLEGSDATHTGFERRETAIARIRGELEKTTAILDHFAAKEREVAAAAPAPRGSSGTPMRDGENVVVGLGDLASEFGVSPRSKALKDAAETQADYLRGLRELADEERRVADAWKDMEAQLNGPLAEATRAHEVRLREIEDAGRAAGVSSERIAEAKLKEAQAHQKNMAALEASLDPLKLLLADMDFELDLLGKTNAERVVEMELRRLGIELGSKEADAAAARIRARVEEYEATQKTIGALDDFRSSFEDNVSSVLDGSKSIKEAVRDLLSDLSSQFARMIAQNWGEQLFGQMGTSGTGSAGGWLSGLFSAFGGARAAGGPVMAGVPYLVGEEGPELVVPKAAGTVVPAGQTAAMLRRPGGATNITFVLPGRNDLRTEAQRQSELARATSRQLSRGTA